MSYTISSNADGRLAMIAKSSPGTRSSPGARSNRREWLCLSHLLAAALMGLFVLSAGVASGQDALPEKAAPEKAAPEKAAPGAAANEPAAAETEAMENQLPAEDTPAAAASDAEAAPTGGDASVTETTEAASPAAGGPTPAPVTGAGPAPETAATEGESAPSSSQPAPDSELVVVSWGGVYSRSQEEAIHHPFTRTSGIEVNAKVYAGDLDQIRAQATAEEGEWDIVDLDPADAEVACNEGLLEKLSFVLPAAPDGTVAAEDFLPGTLHPCGVGSLAWSMVLAHAYGGESDRGGDARPESLEDFFDLSAFPGGRGLRRTPMANLEWALLADGADPAEVYDLLRSEAGVKRAFAKLDTIKDSIVWWEDADEPAQLLDSGEVVMTSAYNAPIFNDIVVREQPFELIWDGQIWDIDLWAMPANAPHREAAVEFLRFATSTEPLARQTRWIPYGPVRRSAVALAEGYVHADVDIAPYLPTTPENLDSALRNDALFWREEGPALVERFNAWLSR